MTIVYFVRHAQPDLSNHDDLKRPLTAKGLQDRHFLLSYFRDKKLDVAFSSPFKRAIDTIKPVTDNKGLKIELVSDFRERKIGDEWISNFHEYCEQQWADFDYKLKNGESLNETQQRNVKALQRILNRYEGRNIIVGSHGTAIGTLINYYDKNFDYNDFKKIQPVMPFVVKFEFNGGKVSYQLTMFN